MKRRVSIYQVYPRVYSKDGKLNNVTKDMKRIADMGFDYLYLLPIHPIGKEGRKGSLGSPYSIADYLSVDPELGTLDDFKDLISEAHKYGLKVMMDIVINHTANDHYWVNEHPEYYLLDKDGKPARKAAEWTDITDLNYDNLELRKELIAMLTYWAKLGVDGYRCDVASGVPYEFWKEADEAIKKINPDFYWLAESTHVAFVQGARRNGYKATSDAKLAEVFDTLYPYSFDAEYKDALNGKDLKGFCHMLNFTYTEFNEHVNELIYLENHDQKRIADVLNNNKIRMNNWLAFSFLYDGIAFVYAGQEAYNTVQPTLFDKMEVDWSKLDHDYEEKLCSLNKLRAKVLANVNDCYVEADNALIVHLYKNDEELLGVFDVNDIKGSIKLDIADNEYHDLINDKKITIVNNEVESKNCPLLIKVK